MERFSNSSDLIRNSSKIELKQAKELVLSDDKISRAEVVVLIEKFKNERKKLYKWFEENKDKIESDAQEELRRLSQELSSQVQELRSVIDYNEKKYNEAQIRAIQEKVGLTGKDIDGKIGPKTIQAIKEFQRKNGLIPDGKIGSLTLEKMGLKFKSKQEESNNQGRPDNNNQGRPDNNNQGRPIEQRPIEQQGNNKGVTTEGGDKKQQNKSGSGNIEQSKRDTYTTIFDPNSPLLGDRIAYENEIKIRKEYGKIITELIKKYCECKNRLIDENLLYRIIAKESRFDENAKSYTGVKGLCQITTDTIKTILNINDTKLKNNPEMADLCITEEITKGKDKRGFYIIDEKKSLIPINQIKLAISYLMYLEDLFDFIKDKDFKRCLIITSYNLGPTTTKKIIEKYKQVCNWEGLKEALKKEASKGRISKTKLREVISYISSVERYYIRCRKLYRTV